MAFLLDWATANPVVAAFLALILALVFFGYLFLRRTLTAFREGFEDQ